MKTLRFSFTPLFQKKENPPLRKTEVGAILCPVFHHGEVAQLVEHHVRNVGVVSSNLIFSTIRKENEKAAFAFANQGAPRFFLPFRSPPRGARLHPLTPFYA